VALSGELSQQERTHALQALRDGRSQVCIATDVAARGIDLPGLELVIHADLPGSPETLLHRSGRTGRAGAKGISALIVTPADYKKAQRLLQGARVVAEWGRAPSADEVRARDDLRMLDHPALTAPLEDMTIARDLLARVGPEQVAAAFVRLWREGRPPPEELTEPTPPPEAGAPRPARAFGASVWFALSVGHTGRAEARWLLPKVCQAGGITRDAIGAIRVREQETFVQIAVEAAPRFGDTIEIEPGLRMTRLEGEPRLDAKPERRPAQRSRKPAAEAIPAPRPAPAATEPPPPAEPAPISAEAPRVKQRWSKAQKDAKARGTATAPAPKDAAAHGSWKGRPPGKGGGKSPGKPVGGTKTGATPKGKPPQGRHKPDAPGTPRRPKGRR
jgi:ATP-dependent RNA helicase DeaD